MAATRGGPDVLVVGAGLACARDLTRAGLGVRVLEASDGVGGRMRFDRQEGFVIDRPFLSGVFLEDELETSSRVLRPAPRWPNPAREVARDLAAQSPVGG